MPPGVTEKIPLRFQAGSLTGDDLLSQRDRGLSDWHNQHDILTESTIDTSDVVFDVVIIEGLLLPQFVNLGGVEGTRTCNTSAGQVSTGWKGLPDTTARAVQGFGFGLESSPDDRRL